MRVSSKQASAVMLRSVNQNTVGLNRVMQQFAQQTRLLVPSDDPIASTRVVQLNRELAGIKQYQSNITTLSTSMSQQEAHLDAINDRLLAIRDKLLLASNGTHNAEAMNSFGTEIEAMLDAIVMELNAKSEDGRYIFSGTLTDTQTVVFDDDTGKYVFQGNNNIRESEVANAQNIRENTTVGDVFFDGTHDLLNDLNDMVAMLKDPTTDFGDPAFTGALSNLIETVDVGITAVAAKIGDLGSRQNTLDMLKEIHTDVGMANELIKKELTDLNEPEAATQLYGYLAALDATQSVYMKMNGLSLFNLI